ncbi:MAG: EAL domain-containing protein [Herminiimonas sp.]|nr:EAL domain-containing protein [Herminiimonas sp.]
MAIGADGSPGLVANQNENAICSESPDTIGESLLHSEARTNMRSAAVARIGQPGVHSVSVFDTDIIDQRQAGEALRLDLAAFEASHEGAVIVDALQRDMPMIYVNPAFCALTGYTRKEVLGRNCRFLQGAENNQPGLHNLRHALLDKVDGYALLRNFRKDGTEFWVELRTTPVRDERGSVTHFVGFQTNVTDRVRYERRLKYQAGHDQLTGLPNRTAIQDRIDLSLERTQDTDLNAVVLIGLDHFKLVNHGLGYGAGDLLLKECADRIRASLRKQDAVARLGGDEFVIFLHNVKSTRKAEQLVATVLAALSEPFALDDQVMSVSASAGIAIHPLHGSTTSSLLRAAGIALHEAKSLGRANATLFSDRMGGQASDNIQRKKELKAALAEDQFCLHYQPKIHARTGELMGFEALVRWNHPERGLLFPASFIQASEELGLICELGAWVMKEACSQMALWHGAGRPMVSVAVNVSATQFRSGSFLADVERTLEEAGLDAQFLELEVTESLAMENPIQFIEILSELHRLGVAISVDDFGTGYSSLSFIKQFPINFLKIDKSFVDDITNDPSDAAICDTIITLAHNLGLLVIAEGVVTVDQAEFLRELGCDILQGYLISKPLPSGADFGPYPFRFGQTSGYLITHNLNTQS